MAVLLHGIFLLKHFFGRSYCEKRTGGSTHLSLGKNSRKKLRQILENSKENTGVYILKLTSHGILHFWV